MAISRSSFPSHDEFAAMSAEYRARYGVPLFAVDCDGGILWQSEPWPGGGGDEECEARRLVVEESWRWGESSATGCGGVHIVWGVPLTENNRLSGGLVSVAEELRVVGVGAAGTENRLDVREAGAALRKLAEDRNLTNSAALAARRSTYEAEQQRAYVLHRDEGSRAASVRSLYTREEPELFGAIRSGDRRGARQVLNRVLVAIYHHGGADLGLLKGFLLELVASMSRAAIEAGASPKHLFGESFASLSSLADVDSMEAMSLWVRRTLERLMDAVPMRGTTRGNERVLDALNFLEQNFATSISLADAARAAGLSPSRFCAVFKQETGTTFSRVLQRIRVDRAALLLRRGNASMGEIALRCGFSDQSYFIRVFRRERGCTPGQFRRGHAR